MAVLSSDAELVLATREGDFGAYGELIHRHHEKIYGFLFQLTGRKEDAEDLTQDTFLHALQKLHKYNATQPLLPWLFTIARRLTIAQWRKKKPHTPLLDSDHPEAPAIPSAHDATALWELAKRELKPDEFTALWMHYQEDLPMKEVAQVLRKTHPHAKVILYRARKNLRKLLEASPEAWLSEPPTSLSTQSTI